VQPKPEFAHLHPRFFCSTKSVNKWNKRRKPRSRMYVVDYLVWVSSNQAPRVLAQCKNFANNYILGRLQWNRQTRHKKIMCVSLVYHQRYQRVLWWFVKINMVIMLDTVWMASRGTCMHWKKIFIRCYCSCNQEARLSFITSMMAKMCACRWKTIVPFCTSKIFSSSMCNGCIA